MKPTLDGRAWLGTGEYYGASFLAELFESHKHPGYYHYAILCTADSFCDESERPVKAAFLTRVHLALLLKDHGLSVADLEWHEVPAADLLVSGERVAAGE